jgi:hypothetical protein
MAFVRWRGNRAELLATVYDQGRSRQLRLACLGGAYVVAPEIRHRVAERFPGIHVDWEAVDRALAAGPPHEQAQTAAGVPNERLEWFHIERRLRYWAAMAEPLRTGQAQRLRNAAEVLAEWRCGKPAFPLAQPLPGWDIDVHTPPATSQGPASLSSDRAADT